MLIWDFKLYIWDCTRLLYKSFKALKPEVQVCTAYFKSGRKCYCLEDFFERVY